MAVQLCLIPTVSATCRLHWLFKALGTAGGEQEHPFPPTQREPQCGGKKQGGEAIPNSSGAAAHGWSQEVPALPHCTSSPCPCCQEPSKEQWRSGPGDAPALQALRPSPSLQCHTRRSPAAPQVPRSRAGTAAGSHSEVAHGSLGTGRTQRKKITHFNKEMCSEREALRSCQHKHRPREQSPGCLSPQLPPSPGSS